MPSESHRSIQTWGGAQRVGAVRSKDQSDVQSILDAGFGLTMSCDTDGGDAPITIRLALTPDSDQLI